MPGQKVRLQSRPPSPLCTTLKLPGRLLGSSPLTSTNQVTFNNKPWYTRLIFKSDISVLQWKGRKCGYHSALAGISIPNVSSYSPTVWIGITWTAGVLRERSFLERSHVFTALNEILVLWLHLHDSLSSYTCEQGCSNVFRHFRHDWLRDEVAVLANSALGDLEVIHTEQ